MKPEHAAHVELTLAREMFWNVRLALIGLIPALLLYYAMLILDTNIRQHIVFMGIDLAIGLPVAAYFVRRGEMMVSDPKLRVRIGNILLLVAGVTFGAGFYFQLPAIKNPSIILTAYTLIIGVVGAAAFTFACHRYSFILFAAGWLGPIVFYFFVFSHNLGSIILGGMAIAYVGVLTFLCLKDYSRRVELILKELHLIEEKEQVSLGLQKVNALKAQQDGDYYLTSLLLKPLSMNRAPHDAEVKVEFITQQYKQFEFRDRKSEIGGDLCSAHLIELNGQPCTIFINADAMGKSIQGAGGALVLGIIFDSIIERTKHRQDFKKMFPERWLKSAFIELHKAFESFDGTMLASAILGIIENQTGVLYSVNLEHPWAAIYRDNKADFLTPKKYYRKLGTPGVDGSIEIETLQLFAGDVVFLGSDGRDDYYIEDPQTKAVVVNEDESLFLRHIENGEGDIERICANICNAGKIKDDLSLMKITFLNATIRLKNAIPTDERISRQISQVADLAKLNKMQEAKNILHALNSDSTMKPRDLKYLTKLAVKCKAMEAAVAFATKYTQIDPLDNYMIYTVLLLRMRLNQLDIAADLGERLILRGYSDKKITDRLATVYEKLGQKERSAELRASN